MRNPSAEKTIQPQTGPQPDSEIDLTDIPEIREIPSDAVIGKFYCLDDETAAKLDQSLAEPGDDIPLGEVRRQLEL